MSLQISEPQDAETRFRDAFKRLKEGKPQHVASNVPITQNNVAREAGCDPSALRKSRFPALIREIQAYVDIQKQMSPPTAESRQQRRAAKRSLESRLDDANQQRDKAESILMSAEVRIIELNEQVLSLQRRLDELIPAPRKIGKS